LQLSESKMMFVGGDDQRYYGTLERRSVFCTSPCAVRILRVSCHAFIARENAFATERGRGAVCCCGEICSPNLSTLKAATTRRRYSKIKLHH
jgi:hypothetical protein